MKEIKFFDNHDVKSFRFWLIVFSGILMVMVFIDMCFWEASLVRPYIQVLAYSGITLYLLIPFLYKNTVEWNKRGMVLKLNTFVFSKTFSFGEIQSVQFTDDTLKIVRSDGEVYSFDLTNIAPQSVEQLKEIFRQRHVRFCTEQDYLNTNVYAV
ncbi:hypothetical protein [Capnocytophaga canis]|uniref:hypothetical protein n=1 Tax=Capnocytophaga canis TaxID=1848903 RepID=UPI00385B47CD